MDSSDDVQQNPDSEKPKEDSQQDRKPWQKIDFRKIGGWTGYLVVGCLIAAVVMLVAWLAWTLAPVIWFAIVGFIADCLWLVTYPASYFGKYMGGGPFWGLVLLIGSCILAAFAIDDDDTAIAACVVIYAASWLITFLDWMIVNYS